MSVIQTLHRLVDSRVDTAVCSVRVVGMHERERYALEMLLAKKAKGTYRLIEDEDADVTLIDVDNAMGHMAWAHLRSHAKPRSLILLSVRVPAGADDYGALTVRKPFSPVEMLDALHRAHRKPKSSKATDRTPSVPLEEAPLDASGGDSEQTETRSHARRDTGAAATQLSENQSSTFIGTLPDIDASDAAAVSKASFDPEHFLLGGVISAYRLAEQSNQPVCLRIARLGCTLYVIPEEQRVLATPTRQRLQILTKLRLEERECNLTTLHSSAEIEACWNEWQMDAFLWLLTLWTSRGRMPVGTDLNARVVLRRWPNMTRLQMFPNAMRIAALWHARPMSLPDTATHLRIPQRFVFAFYSAASALDLTELAEAPVAPPERDGRHKRGLLQRLLGHLRGGQLEIAESM